MEEPSSIPGIGGASFTTREWRNWLHFASEVSEPDSMGARAHNIYLDFPQNVSAFPPKSELFITNIMENIIKTTFKLHSNHVYHLNIM